ncbi:hypothetical protein B0O99DRAFT_614366, partial [Bisporella sp. PMI_857]
MGGETERWIIWLRPTLAPRRVLSRRLQEICNRSSVENMSRLRMADKDTQTRIPLAATDSNSSFFNTVLLKDSAPVKKAASLPVPAYISSKRKAEVIEDKHEDEEDVPATLNCDQIRRKIRTFLNKGEMNVTEFTKAIGVNSNSYGRFMSYKGPYTGCDNGTYEGAFHFFRRREAR